MSEFATLVPPGGCRHHRRKRTFGVEAMAMAKRFGDFAALDEVSLKVAPAPFTRCSARTAPANRRWSNASWAITGPTPAS